MEEKQEIPKKVTKEKHPGRIESGKRLAERNRLKKLEAKNKEHKEKIITQEEEEEVKEKPREINISDKKIKTSDIVYLVLAGMIGGGIYIFHKWKTSHNPPNTKTKEIKSEPEKPDPFYME